MLFFDIAIGVLLIALTGGLILLLWAHRHEGPGIGFAKVFGYIITIAAAFFILVTVYHGFMFWNYGHFGNKGNPAAMMNLQKASPAQQQPGPGYPGPRQ